MPAYTWGVPDHDSNIIFFDGDCAMCSRFVRFCLKRDTEKRFHYAPIDGSTWKESFDDGSHTDKQTIHLLTGRDHVIRTTAIIGILRGLGGPWKLLANTMWLVPRPIRNLGYRFIAWNRQRVSKITGHCVIPDTDERSCILP